MRTTLSRPGLVCLAVCAILGTGCGPVIYASRVVKAEHSVERARAVGAADYAPYEFFYAEAHLHKAREDAGEAAYQDAIRYARTARTFAERSIELARERSSGAAH